MCTFQATLDSIATLLQDLSVRLKNVEAKVGAGGGGGGAAPAPAVSGLCNQIERT